MAGLGEGKRLPEKSGVAETFISSCRIGLPGAEK